MDLKTRFLKVYTSLPLGVRKEIVLVLEEPVERPIGPMTWGAAYIEVENDTELSKRILEKLADLQII